MSKFSQLERFLKQDAWTMSIDSFHGVQRVGVEALRLGYAVAAEFRHRLLDARAAGLVYATLLSLVPFLAVMFSVLKAFGAHLQLLPILAQALEPLGEKGQEITGRIITFVQNLKVGVLGAVGVAALFYTTYSLIDKVEEALNAIWRVRQGRPWARKFTDYLSVVLVGPVLVFAAFGMTASLQSHWLVQQVLEIQPLGSAVIFAAQFLPFVILCGFFTFLYKFVPNTQVRLMSALAGGVTAAVLWQLAGWAFAAFVAGSGKYSAIYSGFAVLILFLIWLYASWLIVLVGAQMAFFHQTPSAYQSHTLWRLGAHALRERLALAVLMQIARRYLDGGRPYKPEELAVDASAPSSVVDDLIDEYVGHGILGRVSEPEGVTLVKPPELVPMSEVFDIINRQDLPAADAKAEEHNPVGALLQRRDQAVQEALDGVTLRSWALEASLRERESTAPIHV